MNRDESCSIGTSTLANTRHKLESNTSLNIKTKNLKKHSHSPKKKYVHYRHHALIHGNVEQITTGIIQLSQKRLDILRQLAPLAEIFVELNSLTTIASGATG